MRRGDERSVCTVWLLAGASDAKISRSLSFSNMIVPCSGGAAAGPRPIRFSASDRMRLKMSRSCSISLGTSFACIGDQRRRRMEIEISLMRKDRMELKSDSKLKTIRVFRLPLKNSVLEK